MSTSDADLKAAFKMFDKDNSGKINVAELKAVMKEVAPCQPELTDDEIAQILKNTDADNDKQLDFKEFKTFMGKLDEDEIRKAFAAFDQDGNESISKEELKQAMKNSGEKLSDTDIDGMIAAADTDKDGKVGFEEFKAMMSQCS